MVGGSEEVFLPNVIPAVRNSGGYRVQSSCFVCERSGAERGCGEWGWGLVAGQGCVSEPPSMMEGSHLLSTPHFRSSTGRDL